LRRPAAGLGPSGIKAEQLRHGRGEPFPVGSAPRGHAGRVSQPTLPRRGPEALLVDAIVVEAIGEVAARLNGNLRRCNSCQHK
jgi:hypothetical protein